jgi:sugar phosphate isomerase/epimerase
MRLTAPLFRDISTPEKWLAALAEKGFTAANDFPLEAGADEGLISEFVAAAKENDIVIAEVGAWCNPLSPDADEREKAMAHCKQQLAFADRVGARCAVNIAGSRSSKWDGPHPANLKDETFDMIVDTVREIIDAVEPERAAYALEPMPWIYPHTTASYMRLIRAVEREAFAVHFDPVNMISSPEVCFYNADLIREFIGELGPWIRGCHAKDVKLGENLTVHIDECCPGDGTLDYAAYLHELDKLDPDTPLVLEHMKKEEDFDRAAAYIRGVAAKEGIATA